MHPTGILTAFLRPSLRAGGPCWRLIPRLAVLLAGVCATGMAEVSPPNFLFILVDDQGWSGTSVPMLPGNAASRTAEFRMPNLDRLAARGVVFSQAYAAHPKCECSRAALQMGRSTTSLNATDKWARAWTAPASDSLANTLKRANPSYRAAHFGKWQWPQQPGEFGYDASDGVTQNEDGSSRDPADPKLTFSLARRASEYMERQVGEGRPFFLQVSFYAPHSPAQALAATLAKFGSGPMVAAGKGSGKGQRGGGPILAAMTEDLDSALGLLFRRLEDLGISGRTHVVYMSDNGMGSALLKGGKAMVDEGGLRVPLIVAGPGIRGGRHEPVPVVGYDVFPTILDLAAPGFALPKGVEGGSWHPVLEEQTGARVKRPIDRMVWHHDVEVDHPQTALRQGDLKLVHWWDTRQNFLYDLSVDPGEARNLADSRPGDVVRLLAELKAHVRAGLGERKFAALEAGQVDPAGGKGEGRPKGKGKGGARPP